MNRFMFSLVAVAVTQALSFAMFSETLTAADPVNPKFKAGVSYSMQLSTETRNRSLNLDGSCVQCSLVHCGHHSDVPEAATLLWNTKYGPAIRGGSTPARVAAYCNQRHIEAYNVTGLENTKAYLAYAAKTGRFAAVGCWPAHFQTYYGRRIEPDGKVIHLVCNNQTLDQIAHINEYSDEKFWQLHMQSGPWCVILKKPNSENPRFDEWWK